MLRMTTVDSPAGKRRFVDFVYEVYAGNPCFRDTQLHTMRSFLNGTDCFTQECHVRPVVVEADGRTCCQAILIHHPSLPVLQVAFFESLPGRDMAVRSLLEEARQEARALGLDRLVVGLNGHVSYGVGFLLTHHDQPGSFDGRYSPAYYHGYFNLPQAHRVALSTYRFLTDRLEAHKPVRERVHATVSFRTMNMRRFRAEMFRFGRLCDLCLADTYLYFGRPPLAMYQMLSPLRLFLRPQNLVFAMQEGREIGFIFWLPDYNQIIPGGRRHGFLKMAAILLTRSRAITKMKVNALGVLPAFRGTGVSVGLIHEAQRYSQSRFSEGETNFVWDNNRESGRLCLRVTEGVFKRYCVYEFPVTT